MQISTPGQTVDPHPPSLSCPGTTFQWELGSPYLTYPFPIHDPASLHKPDYSLVSLDFQDSSIHLHSRNCTGMPSATSEPCPSCLNTRLHVRKVQNKARNATGVMRSAMSYEQLKKKVEGVERSLKKVRLKVCSSSLMLREGVLTSLAGAQ
jgi:hypothetical protein